VTDWPGLHLHPIKHLLVVLEYEDGKLQVFGLASSNPVDNRFGCSYQWRTRQFSELVEGCVRLEAIPTHNACRSELSSTVLS